MYIDGIYGYLLWSYWWLCWWLLIVNVCYTYYNWDMFMPPCQNRTCSRAHFRKLGWGWGGVGIIATVSMATLQDLHLHFMLRYMIFTCTSCYPTWSSLALHATLQDLHLHFMLRSMIFTCPSCYAPWSSLALHATLHDLSHGYWPGLWTMVWHGAESSWRWKVKEDRDLSIGTRQSKS